MRHAISAKLLRGAGDIAGLAADLAPRDPGHGQSGGERQDEGEDRPEEAEDAKAQHERDEQAATTPAARAPFASRRPAPAPRPSVRAGGRQRERQQSEGARRRAGQDQGRRRAAPLFDERGERGDAQHQRKRERRRAKGADAAVAHDFELALARPAAAKTVGDIGEPVFVQGAGDEDERADRQRRANQRRQAEGAARPSASAPIAPSTAPATGDAQAMRSMSSGALGSDSPTRKRVKKRSASATSRAARTKRPGEPKPMRGADQRWAQRNTRTATAPIAVSPNSTMPHWRTKARAAPTSPPRSERTWLSSGDMTKKA